MADISRVRCPKCGLVNPEGMDVCRRCRAPLPKVEFRVKLDSLPGEKGDPARDIQFRRGQVFANRYTIMDVIGRGGMGCIYKVYDNTLNEEVALKTLLPQFMRDKVVVGRFFNEARIARHLSHPNIVRVHDIATAGDVIYISMEYLHGKSLRETLDETLPGHRLPLNMTLRIMDELCAALEYAHRYTVHRDIKPENVMVIGDGAIKLMDFGISKLITQEHLTATSIVMGTPVYMPPEQLRDCSHVDGRADIYAVGVVLYEILSGSQPTGILQSVTKSAPDVPSALDNIVAKCVEPSPDDRFQSAGDLRKALQSVREGVESGSRAQGLTRDIQRPSNGKGVLRRATGVALVALVILLAVLALRDLGRPAASGRHVRDPFQEGFEQVENVVERMLPYAIPIAEGHERWQEALKEGNRLWELANESAKLRDPLAFTYGRSALQCFLAPILWSEGGVEDMVFVVPGKVEISDASGISEVFVEGFFIDETEVTIGQYYEFCHRDPWRFPPNQNLNEPDLPVTMVTFYDAQAYAAYIGKRLLTEAQWARAAYGAPGASSYYPWGDARQDGTYSAPGPHAQSGVLMPVGSYKDDLTEWGCWDMAGNVREWTRTEYQGLPYDPTDGRENEAMLYFGFLMSTRGGHFADPNCPPLCARFWESYVAKSPVLGFRCALELPSNLEEIKAWLDHYANGLIAEPDNGTRDVAEGPSQFKRPSEEVDRPGDID